MRLRRSPSLRPGCRRRSPRRARACRRVRPATASIQPSRSGLISCSGRNSLSGIPPAMGERGEFGELGRIGVGWRVGGGFDGSHEAPDCQASFCVASARARARTAGTSSVADAPLAHDAGAVDPDVGHALAPRDMDQMRDRVEHRLRRRRSPGRRRRVRVLAGLRGSRSSLSRPSARAPSSVAIAQRRRAPAAPRRRRSPPWRAGSPGASRANRSSRLFDAAPSVPSATLTPARQHRCHRRDAAGELQVRRRTMHDVAALRAPAARCRARCRCTACTATKPGPVTPRRSRRASGWRRLSRSDRVDLLARLGEMRLDRQVELPRVRDDLRERLVADGVGRVRRERERQPRLVLERVARGEPALQVARRRRRRTASESRGSASPSTRAHSRACVGARRGVRIEVHVVAAGDAAAQHFGGAEQRAVVARTPATRSGPRAARCAPRATACSATSSAMPRSSVIAVWRMRVDEARESATCRSAARRLRAAHSAQRRRRSAAPRRSRPSSTMTTCSVSTPAGSTGTIQRASMRRSTGAMRSSVIGGLSQRRGHGRGRLAGLRDGPPRTGRLGIDTSKTPKKKPRTHAGLSWRAERQISA